MPLNADRTKRLAKARKAIIAAGILLLAGAVIYIVLARPDLSSLAAFGYPGVSIIMFLSSSTVLFPAPGFAAVLAGGSLWNPLLVGLAAGIGAATGELTGYLLGRGSGEVFDLEQGENWRRAHRWLKKHGVWAILALAAIPNPVFDAVGLVAGSLSFPVKRFWIACLVGNSFKYTLIATLAGSAVGWWVSH
jgi:uncharacterized membrane protein YdjX (TVP38/TMEM64 family)